MGKRLLRKANGETKIKQSLKDKINNDLNEYNTNNPETYYENIPLQDIFDVLKKYNIYVVQEDGRNWSGMLLGRDSKTRFDLVLEKDGERKRIENSSLSLSWYKFDDYMDRNDEWKKGKYEILTYLV